MSDSKEEYIVYFHLKRLDSFLLTDKTFGSIDNPKLKVFDDKKVAEKYIENKDTDDVICTLWIVGSEELNKFLNSKSK